jgi:DNA-binding transcriptional ArsR family regulator
MADTPSRIRLRDPGEMRALAHPTRLRLLGELRARGPQNVGMLSEIVDEAPGSVSYHLSTLAKHGFVEEAPELAPNGRERWWRAAHSRTVWDRAETLDDPERRLAADMMQRAILARWVQKLEHYLDVEPTLDRDWITAAAGSDAILHLTADELAQLREELDAVAARWEARSQPDRPGAAQVTMLYFGFRSDV